MARRIVHQRGAGRSNMWLGIQVVPVVVLASSNTILASLDAASLALRPFTIVRSRFEVQYKSDQTGTSETPFGIMGLGVFSEVAAGSVARMPDPATEPNYDWYVYQALQEDFEFISGVGVVSRMGQRYIVDSKVMRKVGPNDDITVLHAQVAAVGATISVLGRFLIKLH